MQDFFNWQGVVGTIFGVIGTIVSIFVLLKSRKIDKFLEEEKGRLAEQVKFELTDGKFVYKFPFLRRQEVARQEVQGRLGNIPMKIKGKRYSIHYTNLVDFYHQLDEIFKGSHETQKSVLTIVCTEEEFKQFDFPTNSVTKMG